MERRQKEEETGDQMRNWRWRRKGGGGENAVDEQSVATSDTTKDDGNVVIAVAAGTVFPGEGAWVTVTSRSPAFWLGPESLQPSVQHGMEACIAAAPPAALVMQQAPTAGKAATKTSTATAATAVKCFVVMLNGLTILMNSMVSMGISSTTRHGWSHATR